ncbi:hypothetical protein D3C78_666140 [compost metagenome]
MQRTTQRWNELLSTVRPNSSSERAGAWAETRWADETMEGDLFMGIPFLMRCLGRATTCAPNDDLL